MFEISPLDYQLQGLIQQRIDQKTKPPGSLGGLEALAMQLAMISGPNVIEINQPTMLVFAADHGIAAEGISIAPSEVTGQMVMNFLSGGAAINCFCRTNGMALEVIDAGILNPFNDQRLTVQSLGRGTASFVHQPAMSLESVDKGLILGANVVYRHVGEGTNVFGFGEMGIGNTTTAAALMSAITGFSVDQCVGRGTGINAQQYAKKVALVSTALATHRACFTDIKQTLAAIGGFEIVQMTGAMLAAAECDSVLLIDGFISSVAALVAIKINPNVRDYMVFCHQSGEAGHARLLEYLNAKALLSLELRLGEGTGAALALPLIRSAQSFYNTMASFDSAGIEPV